MEIKINIEKKHLYILAVICLITIGVVVIAQTSAPVFYHTLAEIYDKTGGSSIDADGNGIVDSLAISGSLGIGTDTPDYALDVAGEIRTNIRFRSTGSGYADQFGTSIQVGGNYDTMFTVGGSNGGYAQISTFPIGDDVVFWDIGNIGIGNDLSPDAKLEVVGDLMVSSLAAKDGDRFIVTTTGSVGIGDTGPDAKVDILNTGSGASFRVDDSSDGDTTPFIIDASGKVGIGTTSPGAKLEVKGGSIKATGGLIIETRTSDLPTTEATGRIWLRTDI